MRICFYNKHIDKKIKNKTKSKILKIKISLLQWILINLKAYCDC